MLLLLSKSSFIDGFNTILLISWWWLNFLDHPMTQLPC